MMYMLMRYLPIHILKRYIQYRNLY